MKPLYRGFLIGWGAVKKNWVPAVILQLVMVSLGYGYAKKVPLIMAAFEKLAQAKESGGYFFSFCAGSIAAGVLAEIFRVYFVDGGKWRKDHVIDMLFKMILMGGMSVITDCFYRQQGVWFGTGTDWMTIHKKVAVDMLLYTFLLTAPLQSILFLWKNEGFDWSVTQKRLSNWQLFLADQYLPLSLSNLCFWLPIVYVIYSMPSLLQMPLNLIAITIWGILIVTVTGESRKA